MTADAGAGSAADAIETAIRAALGRVIGPDENFFDAGLTSLDLVRVHADGTRGLSAPPPVTALFAYPNLRALRRFLGRSAEGAPAGRPLAPPVRGGAAGRRELRRRARGEVA